MTDAPEDHMAAGRRALAAGERSKAIAAFTRALDAAPGDVGARMALARAQMMASRFDEAIRTYTAVVEQDAANHEAWRGLAEALRFRDHLEPALDAIGQAMRLAPENPRVLAQNVFIRMRACAWDGLDDSRIALRDLTFKALASGRPSPMRPFMAATCYDDPALAMEVGASESRRLRFKPLPRPAIKRARDGRVTVGYLSAGFCNHPTGQLVRRLFATHDRKRVRIVALDISRDDGSDLRRDIHESCDTVVDLTGLNDLTAALAIRDAGVDILVDLHGWLQNNRMAIAAHRPCPVQVSWLGFPGTTGAPFYDYLIGDRIVAPPEHQRFFSEQIVRLPACYQPNDPDPLVSDPVGDRAAVGLPRDTLVFACFNVAYKIDPESFDLWCQVLEQAPQAALWLLETNAVSKRNLLAEAARRGIDPSRLVFAPFQRKPDHLARLGLADMALDTGICNGHTTTTDALWAGVPVLTRQGRHFASRVAASLDTAAGLKGLVARNPKEFVNKALFFAANHDRRSEVRQHLRVQRAKLPLFDITRMARNLEAAYHAMWARHQQGQPAAAMDLK